MERPTPLVEITHVELPEPDGTIIRARSLGRPQSDAAGTACDGTYTFEVLGWVVGAELAAADVTVALDGTPLWEGPVDGERPEVTKMFPDAPGADRPGFFLAASALALPHEFEVRLDATLRGAGETRRAPLARISGRRAPLRTGFAPRFRPLMVTGFSRTGSNMFLRLLGCHPAVLTYRPFQFESRITHYWVDVLRELTEPSGYRRQMRPYGVSARGWWIGNRSPVPWVHHDEAIERELGGAVGEVAVLAQHRIDSVCDRLAATLEQPAAAYLAEKQLPGHAPTMLWDLYPDSREVFLVRDFRDMMASIIAANRRWAGPPRFGRADAASDADHARRFRRFVADLLGSWHRRAGRAHLVRYEDLIRQPRETISGLLDYLELETGPGVLARLVDSVAERDPASDVYRTSATAEASIGRWREHLAPDVLEACEEVFGPALERFGYRTAA